MNTVISALSIDLVCNAGVTVFVIFWNQSSIVDERIDNNLITYFLGSASYNMLDLKTNSRWYRITAENPLRAEE